MHCVENNPHFMRMMHSEERENGAKIITGLVCTWVSSETIRMTNLKLALLLN